MNSTPVIGWEELNPVPENFDFTPYLSNRKGDLLFEELNLPDLFRSRQMQSPLEVVYLPLIRRQVAYLQSAFDAEIAEIGYPGRFLYAYASKANAAEEVIRTVMGTHAHHEMSSAVDVLIAKMMREAGHLGPDKLVLANGFKGPGSPYATALVDLQRIHGRVIPILETPEELETFVQSGLQFELGLRQKSYGSARTLVDIDRVNSRFGMDQAGLNQTIHEIRQHPQLKFVMLHAMVGSQILDPEDFVDRLRPSLHLYAELKKENPDLRIFNFGGGIPVEMTLDFKFDYRRFAQQLLAASAAICGAAGVEPPDIMGEMGRYTVAEHGAHLFRVTDIKENGSKYPWYIIDGSIMSSFPDSWALGERFTVLPLNHLDRPFQRAQLGGITCDSDDMYPRDDDPTPLYLPVVNPQEEPLYIGFFSIGAYQEMLGGAGGSKHCVLPEAGELIIDRDAEGQYQYEFLAHQDEFQVLANLGYKIKKDSDSVGIEK